MICPRTSLQKGNLYVPIPGPGREGKGLRVALTPAAAVAAVRIGQSCPAAHLSIGVSCRNTPWVHFFIALLWCEEVPSHAVISCVLPTLSSPTLGGCKLYLLKDHSHRWVMIVWKLQTAKKPNPRGLGTVLHVCIKGLTVGINAINSFSFFSHMSHS